MENNQAEHQKEERIKNEITLRELSDTIEHNNLCNIEIPKGGEKKGQKTYLKN